MFSRGWRLLHVFPLGTGCMFKRGWRLFVFSRARRQLHVFPRLALIVFPLCAGCTFSRAWRLLHASPRYTPFTCFVIQVLIALYTSIYYDWPVSGWPILTSKIQTNYFTSRPVKLNPNWVLLYLGGFVTAVNLTIKLLDRLCLSNQQNGLLPKHPGYPDARNAVLHTGSSLSSRLFQTS